MGPFYRPDAPVRNKVGSGYLLMGVVRSAGTCEEIAGARIEFWLAGPNGRYDDDHRATVFTNGKGRYSFESDFPALYLSRPPHTHIRVSAPGFKVLVTQHYPKLGAGEGYFELVLISAK